MPLAANFPLKDSTLTIVPPKIDKVESALPDEALREQLLYEIGVQKAKLAERAARNLKVLSGSI